MTNFSDSVQAAVNTTTADTGDVTAKIAQTAPKVASSIYETGPKDAVVAVDRYGKRAVSWLNQEAAGVKGAFDGFFSNNRILSLGKSTLNEIGQTANSALKAVADAKKQISSYTGLNLNSLGAAKASLQNAAVTTLANVSGLDTSKIMRDTDNVLRISSRADAGSVTSLFSAANSILGTTVVGKLFDTQSESAVWGSLMQQASQLGMTDLFDTLWDKVDKNDKQYGGNVAYYSASNSIRTVITNGDTVMLNKLIDKLGGSAIMAQYPLAITDFLANYAIDYDATPGDYPQIRSDLVTTLNRLDPTWLVQDGFHRTDPFTNANQSILAIFTQNSVDTSLVDTATATADPDSVTALIASSYPRQSSTTLLRAFYPNIPYA